MPKKNIGVNLDEEEIAIFEKNRDEAGFDSNADFIKARCLNKTPSAQVRSDDSLEPEMETSEERRRRMRISAVMLKNLPISSLSADELKLYNVMLDVILKTHKVDALQRLEHGGRSVGQTIREFEPKYTVVGDHNALPEKSDALLCFDATCNVAWEHQFRESRRKHMREVHGWTTEQLIAVGDL